MSLMTKFFMQKVTSAVPRTKALRVDGSNIGAAQRIRVKNFSPTGEIGYTIVFIFCLDSNRPFGPGVGGTDILYAKRGSSILVSLLGDQTTYHIDQFSGNSSDDYAALDKLVYIATRSDTADLFVKNNVGEVTHMGASLPGFDTVTGATDDALEIFFDPGNINRIDGYCAHISVFKGMLSDSELTTVIEDNVIPPAQVANCELYLNFSAFVNDAGTIRFTDQSQANRTSNIEVLNYSSANLDPGDPAYSLVPIASVT